MEYYLEIITHFQHPFQRVCRFPIPILYTLENDKIIFQTVRDIDATWKMKEEDFQYGLGIRIWKLHKKDLEKWNLKYNKKEDYIYDFNYEKTNIFYFYEPNFKNEKKEKEIEWKYMNNTDHLLKCDYENINCLSWNVKTFKSKKVEYNQKSYLIHFLIEFEKISL